jgi:hypothetical protein
MVEGAVGLFAPKAREKEIDPITTLTPGAASGATLQATPVLPT